MRTVVVLLLLARVAAAQPGSDPLAAASAALIAGEYQQVLELAPLPDDAAKADRAESHRLLGLAHFFLADYAAAEIEFLAYLGLDLDGSLDPSQYPPEAVTFFEDVRARNAAELKAKRPRQRRWRILNLLPPVGQAQNKQYTRALVFGGIELALAATNLTTYFVLRSRCSSNDFTCESGLAGDTDSARRLRFINYASGVAFIGVYIYGVIDGFRGFKRRSRERAEPIVGSVEGGGLTVGASLHF